MTSQARGAAWLLFSIALGGLFASGVPWALAQTPWSFEQRLSDWVGGGVDPDSCATSASPQSRAALARLVTRLYPLYPGDVGLPVHIELVQGETVNAFAGLAGRIHVYAGLLEEATSPEELAGVLAHEIEHVRCRHVLQGTFLSLLSRAVVSLWVDPEDAAAGSLASLFLQLQFSRTQETQADEGGIQRLRDARIDPAGLAEFFKRASRKDNGFFAFASSHPTNEARAAAARAGPAASFEPLLTAAEWQALREICRAKR